MMELSELVLPAVDNVIEMGIADENRLGIMGYSYGGYCTVGLITQTTRFKAAVCGGGVYNLTSYYGELTKQEPAMALGGQKVDRDVWTVHSGNNVSDILTIHDISLG